MSWRIAASRCVTTSVVRFQCADLRMPARVRAWCFRPAHLSPCNCSVLKASKIDHVDPTIAWTNAAAPCGSSAKARRDARRGAWPIRPAAHTPDGEGMAEAAPAMIHKHSICRSTCRRQGIRNFFGLREMGGGNRTALFEDEIVAILSLLNARMSTIPAPSTSASSRTAKPGRRVNRRLPRWLDVALPQRLHA